MGCGTTAAINTNMPRLKVNYKAGIPNFTAAFKNSDNAHIDRLAIELEVHDQLINQMNENR